MDSNNRAEELAAINEPDGFISQNQNVIGINTTGVGDVAREWVHIYDRDGNWTHTQWEDEIYVIHDEITATGSSSTKPLISCSYFTAAGYSCSSTRVLNFKLNFLRDMTPTEVQIFNEELTEEEKSKYVLNALIANDKADQYFPGWTRNSKGDALRQGIASALNAKDLGVSRTLQLQNARENNNDSHPFRNKELQMKRTNEAFGRNLIVPYGPTLSANTLCNMVIYARANGGLVFVTPLASDNRPYHLSNVVTTADSQTPPNNDCPPGSGDESGPGMPVGVC